MISLKGLDKADVLAALYNASRPQGLGFLAYKPQPMARDEAAAILETGATYFDYLQGRVMKVDLSGDELNTWGYDRDNGDGAAERALSSLRAGGPDSPEIAAAHQSGTLEAAELARKAMGREHSTEEVAEGVRSVSMGLSDVKGVLARAVESAVSKVATQ